MGWNLGFFFNDVVDRVSVTLFPQTIAIPRLIASIKINNPPTTTALASPADLLRGASRIPSPWGMNVCGGGYNRSGHLLFLLSHPCYYSAIIQENTVLYEIPSNFFSTTYTQQEYCIF